MDSQESPRHPGGVPASDRRLPTDGAARQTGEGAGHRREGAPPHLHPASGVGVRPCVCVCMCVLETGGLVPGLSRRVGGRRL